MDIREILNTVLFNVLDREVTISQLVVALFIIFVLFILYRLFIKRFFPNTGLNTDLTDLQSKRIRRAMFYIFSLLILIVLVIGLGLDFEFFTDKKYRFKLSNIFEALLIIQLARVFDWLISKVIIHPYYLNRDSEKKKISNEKVEGEETAFRTVQYLLYVIAGIIILRNFNWDLTFFPYTETITDIDGAKKVINHAFRITDILSAVFVFLIARLVVWVITQLFLYGYYRQRNVNIGSQYAINQLLKYVIYVIAAFIALDTLGVKMTLVYGGLAALLVGVGLGLQQTFNDFFSGLILLFERTVEVGDTVQVGELIGTVKKIGLRASVVEGRESITVIVPNSKLVVDNVVNWSHADDKVRFKIDVGVAYGSDTEKVKELLLQVAKDNPYIIDFPAPFIRFINFGESSLIFELHFWSRNFIIIEDVKSDLRFKIDKTFRENKISIPFPQTDVWIRKDPES